MALYQNVSPTINNLGNGVIEIRMGPEGYAYDTQRLRQLVLGKIKEADMLAHQIGIGLDAAGFDPQGKTFAQIKAAIEALILKW